MHGEAGGGKAVGWGARETQERRRRQAAAACGAPWGDSRRRRHRGAGGPPRLVRDGRKARRGDARAGAEDFSEPPPAATGSERISRSLAALTGLPGASAPLPLSEESRPGLRGKGTQRRR